MFKMLQNGFKGKIKKGDIVEIWHEKYGVATVSNGSRVDYVLNIDLQNVSRETLKVWNVTNWKGGGLWKEKKHFQTLITVATYKKKLKVMKFVIIAVKEK